MMNNSKINNKTVFLLAILTSLLFVVTACSTSEDEEFVSAFDTPLAASMETEAHRQQTAALEGRLLTAVANNNTYKSAISATTLPAEPLVVSTKSLGTKPLSFKTPVNQIEEEAPQLDWSKVKRWSGAAARPSATRPKAQPVVQASSDITRRTSTPAPVIVQTQNYTPPKVARPTINPVQVFTPRSVPATPVNAQASDTFLNAGDTINITVYGEEELSGPYLLDNRGMITVPLIGEVHAAGLSKAQLQHRIAEALKSGGFLETPYVSVTIGRLQPIYILGEVRTPGQYDYEPTLDVFKAVALAGGYTPRAAKSKIFITRLQNGQKIKLEANEHTDLLPGDSILVKQRFF